MRRHTLALIVTAVVLMGAIIIHFARGARVDGASPKSPTKKAWVVKVSPVALGDIAKTYVTTGTIAAVTEAELMPKVQERIVAMPLREGDPVKAGMVVARLDSAAADRQADEAEADVRAAEASLRDLLAGARPEERAQAQAAAQQARATAEKTQRALAHAGDIYGSDGIPAQTIAAARARRDVAKAELKAAKATLEAAKSEVAASETALADARRDVQRTTELLEIGGASQEQLDKDQARVDTADARLSGAKAARDAAEARAAAAQETLRGAETDLAHVETLYDGPVPQRELDEARGRYEEAQAAVTQAQEKLKMLQAGPTETEIEVARAKVEQARRKLAVAKLDRSYCTITSPIDGLIVKRMADVGDMARPGSPILTVASTSRLMVKSAVPDRYATTVHIGQQVQVSVEGQHTPLRLKITRLYGAADPRGRLVPFEAILPPGTKAAVGAMARVTVLLQEAKQTPVAPADAILSREGGTRVAFIVEGGAAVRRIVTVGIEAEGRAQITSGLKVGDQLVVAGQEMLKDKMPVKVARPPGAGKRSGSAGGRNKPGVSK